MIFAGIDAGSRTVKVVLIDKNRNVLGTGLLDQGIRQAELAYQLFEQTTAKIGARTEYDRD
jgi:activator of 2-hydroxyglutaryl-CoA dehydratase